MSRRLAAACCLAVLCAACGDTVQALSPRYFYGQLVSDDGEELCVLDPRDDEPDRTLCMALPDGDEADGFSEGDLLRVRFEGDEGDERVVEVDSGVR